MGSITKMASAFSVCITGATGWLGQSLIGATNDLIPFPVDLSLYGRTERDLVVRGCHTYRIQSFNTEAITTNSFDCFAPFAFLTRDKSVNMTDSDYLLANKQLIRDSVEIIRSGKVGSVINLSSGVVSNMSQNQKLDGSYNLYASLKAEQEDSFYDACVAIGIPLINCRVFSLTGIDMPEPNKYAIGNLISQAMTTKKILLDSPATVLRRYMDSRELMNFLLRLAITGKSVSLETGGIKVSLFELSNILLEIFHLPSNSIEFKDVDVNISNHYFSERNDFEDIAHSTGLTMKNLSEQIFSIIDACTYD